MLPRPRDMLEPRKQREVIDVDDLDIFCTGVRHCIRIDRSPSPRPKKRMRDSVTISLVDSDNDDPLVSPDPPHPQSPPRPPSMDHRTELQRITQSELASRTARLDASPTKKRAASAIKMAVNAVANHTMNNQHQHEMKRKERVLEVIEISSDSEPEDRPPKRQKLEEHVGPQRDADDRSADKGDISKLEADFSRAELRSSSQSNQGDSDLEDEDDRIDFLASLNISNEANWVPLPERNKAEDLTPMNESDIDTYKPQPLPPFRVPRRRPPIDHRDVPFDWTSVGPWGIFKHCGLTRHPKPFYHARRQDTHTRRRLPNLYHEQGYTKLELTAKYPHLASGSVNKIVQSQGVVVLSSVVEGGLEDPDDDEDLPAPPAENKPGSLVVYHHGRVHVASAHCHQRETCRGSVMKYYTICDVAFNPHNPRQFLTSGYDLAVQSWEILNPDDDEEQKGVNAIHHFPLDSRPQDLVFSSEHSALVITCHDGTVRLYSQDLFEDMVDAQVSFKKFYVSPKGLDHAAGSALWGKGPSSHLLFTSSEPTNKSDHSGFHHAFDTCKGVQAIQFDATEAGDAASLSPNGTTLALFTCGKDNIHPIRLYDVRRKVKEAYETVELEKFKARRPIDPHLGLYDSEEVNEASFSPDGCLLAVARSDNELHVYDVRVLSRGPLCRFGHHDSDAVGGGGFGIVAAKWIQGRDKIGIVSGGNDGCVRLWEPGLGSKSDVQGAVIGRTDFEVAHFSVGNRQKGELPLVIGDSGGGMHTYDFTNPDGIPI